MGEKAQAGLRAIAIFEGVKGAGALLAGVGLFSLQGHNLEHAARGLIEWIHLNPAGYSSNLLLHSAEHTTDADLRLLGCAAFAYALLRGIESWGLWHSRAWAKWLGVLSGTVYLPFEVLAWWQHRTVFHAAVFAINLFIVIVLLAHLRRRRPTASTS